MAEGARNRLLGLIAGGLRPGLRRSTAGSVLAGVASQGVLIVSGVLSARLLGVEGRGLLALLVLFPVLIALLGALGLPQAVTYFVSRSGRPREIYRRLRPVMLAQLLLLVPVHAITVLIYTHAKAPGIQHAAWLTLCAVPAVLAQQYGLALLQGQENYKLFNVLRVMPAAFYAVLISCVFLAGDGTLFWVAGAWAVGYFLAGLITFGVARLGLPRRSTSAGVELPAIREMVAFGTKGLVGWSSPLESFRVDQLFAGLVLSPTALGYYVVAQALTNLPKFLAQSIGMVAFPAISGRTGDPGVPVLIRRFLAAVGALAAAVAIGLAIGAPWIIGFFFGHPFLPAAPIARILLIGAWFLALRRILVECLRGLGYPAVSTYAELSLYPCLGILVPLLLAPLGVEGLAAGVAVAQGIALAVAVLFMIRLQPAVLDRRGREQPHRTTAGDGGISGDSG